MSPKAAVPAVVLVLAGVLLWLLTGNQEWLIAALSGVVTGGLGAAAPPVPGVTTRDVKEARDRGRIRDWRRPRRRLLRR